MAMTIDRALEVLATVTNRAMQGSETRDAYDCVKAHLTQPAQAVDVGVIREVIAQLVDPADYERECILADKLTRAIGTTQEGLKVPDGCVLVAIERGEGYEDVHPELVAEDCFVNAVERGWRYRVISPTDGEG